MYQPVGSCGGCDWHLVNDQPGSYTLQNGLNRLLVAFFSLLEVIDQVHNGHRYKNDLDRGQAVAIECPA